MKLVERFLKFLGNYALFVIGFPIVLGIFVIFLTGAYYIINPIIIIGIVILLLWYAWDFVKFISRVIRELFIGFKKEG